MIFIEQIIITAPKLIGNDFLGASFIAELYHISSTINNSTLIIDFKDTRWLRANLSAALGAIFRYSYSVKNNNVKLINLSESILKILRKNSFLENFGLKSIYDTYNSTVKYQEFNPLDRTSFSVYVRDEFIPSLKLDLNPMFVKKFRVAIEELFQNCRIHGSCDKIYVCGQFFPSENRLYFTIVNLGTTIKENIEKRYPEIEISSINSILWAIRKGNTTRIDDSVGGIGLPFLIDFLDKTHGELNILSDFGCFNRISCLNNVKECDFKFSGTMVTLIFTIDEIIDKNIEQTSKINSINNFF